MRKKVLGIIIILITIIGITGCGNTNNESKKEEEKKKEEKLNIVASASKGTEYEKYDNGLISLDIPKGWKVEIAKGVDYIHYSFKVTNPKDPNYMLLFALKLEGFLKSKKAQQTWNYYYPTTGFGKNPVISPKTTEAFYKVWNQTAKIVNKQTTSGYFHTINDLKVVQNLGAQKVIGGDVLRITYNNKDKKKQQALVTAHVVDVGSYQVNQNWNVFSKKVDVWPMNVYNIVILSAPDEDFNEWQPVLDHSLSTLQFSDKFMKAFNKEENSIVASVKANAKIYDEISDMIMDSWNKRNDSYDRISQKQSDATLGYERVYNTETNEVYRAYNGFIDGYDGNKYKPITEDMYKEPISGYINK